MKSAKTIIEHLRRKPLHSKVLEIACYEKIKAMLPPAMAKAILFIYKKNQTLYFVLNHPGMKMEFHYKHTLIKNLLNKLKDFDSSCKNIEVSEVKSFVSNRVPPIVKTTPPKKRYYVEKSKGQFHNGAKDPALKAIFDDIKSLIGSKNET
jgi:hypothetical protein